MMRLPALATALALLLAAAALAGCEEKAEVEMPAAVELTREAVGHYCQMTVLDHEGPKAQIHLAGNPHPIWFTQVRDAVAFTRLPEEPKDYVAIYVNDMDKAPSWAEPGIGNWIDARKAFFVIESRRRGGMGAPEAIPFGTREGADAFVAANGGRIAAFDEIPDEYVLAPVEPAGTESHAPAEGGSSAHEVQK